MIYTLFAYQDMDGGIAAAICLRYLNHLKKSNRKNTHIKFLIEPVPRPKEHQHSICGLLRTHYAEFNIPKSLIQTYDDFIDLAEMMHHMPHKKSQIKSAQSLFSSGLKLYSLFHSTHPAIDKKELYKLIVCQISQNSCVEDLFDSDVLYQSIFEYEKKLATIY